MVVAFSIDLDIGVYYVVQLLAIRFRDTDVSSDCDGDPICIQTAKERLTLVGMLLRFGRIDRYPAEFFHVELGPAVITSNGALVPVVRDRESHNEPGRNAKTSRFRNKERVKVGAVARPRTARVQRVSPSPACAALVVTHRRNDIVVECSGLSEGIASGAGNPRCLGQDRSFEWDQLVGLQVTSALGTGGPGGMPMGGQRPAGNAINMVT